MSRVIPQGDSTLPPPGDARREVLRERTDSLAEAAETLGTDHERISPKAFEIDNEIAERIDDMDVSHQQAEYAYCWVNHISQRGMAVRAKIAQKWEVVRDAMPEGIEFKTVDTTRVHGDVMLMRIRRDRFKLLQIQDEKNRASRQGAVTQGLEQLGARHANKGIIVHPDMSDMNPRIQSRMMARQVGTRAVDQMLRDGTVPGMEV